MTNFFLPLLGLVGIASAFVPTNVVPRPLSMESGTRLRMFNFGGSGGGASVPKNASDRDNKAIAAIRSTIFIDVVFCRRPPGTARVHPLGS